jgi:hypothetical protein
MYFLRTSLSVTVLSFFLGTTYAQVNDPKSSSTTAPPHTITNQPAQTPCLLTVNGIVFNTCIKASRPGELSTTPESQPQDITTAPWQGKCLITINGIVYNTCSLFLSTIGDSQITVAPRNTASKTFLQGKCQTTKNGRVFNICDSPNSVPIDGSPGYRQLNAACLTTLTAREGHIVVVDCGDGFESGHPPTMTSPSSDNAKPTTVCIERRCFDVIGTFRSPASATATPTQTQLKGEL